MNCGDVFILDTGVVLFVWVGKEASRTERMKVSPCSCCGQLLFGWVRTCTQCVTMFYLFQALEHARQLRDERGKANIVVVEDGQEKEMTKEELEVLVLPIKLTKTRSDRKTFSTGLLFIVLCIFIINICSWLLNMTVSIHILHVLFLDWIPKVT